MAHVHSNGESYFCGKIKEGRERRKRAFLIDQASITSQASYLLLDILPSGEAVPVKHISRSSCHVDFMNMLILAIVSPA